MLTDLIHTPPPSASAGVLPAFTAASQRGLAADWVAYLRGQVAVGQLAEGTVATYSHATAVWLAYLERVARTDAPTPGTVSAFLAAILPGRRPAAANLLLAAVRSLFRWAGAHDRHPDIARGVRGVRLHHGGPLPCLDHLGVRGLLALVENDDLRALRDRALVSVMYGTGVRCVSLHRARVGDLDMAGGTLRHQGKGRRSADAVAYLPGGAMKAVGDFLAARHAQVPLADDQPLMIAVDHACFGMALSGCSMNRIIRALMERAGHARRGPDGRLVNAGQYTAHSLRRSALTTAADAHGIEVAAAVAGHASPETTRRAYVRVKLDGRLREAAVALDLGVTG